MTATAAPTRPRSTSRWPMSPPPVVSGRATAPESVPSPRAGTSPRPHPSRDAATSPFPVTVDEGGGGPATPPFPVRVPNAPPAVAAPADQAAAEGDDHAFDLG